MEIRARYVLIGLFTLAVIAGGFGFVYWLNNSGALLQRSLYRIHYEKTVSGLLKGSAVLFNGIRVGEVTSLDLSAEDPRRIVVSIAVDRQTPIRTDTKAGIEFQGLAGAPVVSLFAGSAAAPSLMLQGGEPPVLVADPNTGQTMTESAREALRHIDSLVTENSGPLRSAIASIDKFAGALARNSDRVDGIVAGLERLTGGGQKAKPNIYELEAARGFAGIEKVPEGQLSIPEPTALNVFETEKVLTRSADGQSVVLDNAQWPDVLPRLLQARFIQSFENAGYQRVYGRASEGLTADYQLLTDVRRFHVALAPAATAEVEFAARIAGKDGQISQARIFRAAAPASGTDGAAVTSAINQAFGKALAELVPWVLAAIEQPGPDRKQPSDQP
jgi:phospholipid/cholesterol/gamma-HCH transport system substrate-binding protein